MLDDRPAHPGEGVGVLLHPGKLEPERREELEGLLVVQAERLAARAVLHVDFFRFAVDRDLHVVPSATAFRAEMVIRKPSPTAILAPQPKCRPIFSVPA